MAFELEPRDVRDRHVLTKLITKELHEDESVGSQIAPIESVNARKVDIAVREFSPAGLGQFKGVNADTPIRRGGGSVQETLTQLVDLEEMEPLDTDDLINLNSPDTRLAKSAARDIAQIGLELAIRNRNLTRWMRWKAFRDALTVTFNDGTAVDINYDLGNADGGMSGSHKLSLGQSPLSGNPWDDASNAEPVSDVEAMVDLISTDLGVDGAYLHMNKKTFRTLQKVDELKEYLLSHYEYDGGQALKIPSSGAMETVFDLDGGVVVENGYYEDTSGTMHRYIPEGYILMTAPYEVDNETIAQVYDGPVVLADDTERLKVANNPGLQLEIFADKRAKSQFIRLSTARMIWIRRKAFVWAQVYSA